MLELVSNVLVFVVAALHVVFFNLESLTWYRGSAKGFGVKPEHYDVTAVLAANQGFYNLVLAAGLFCSLLTGDWNMKVWFCTAVFCCGIIGYITTGSDKILKAQCAPSVAAIGCLFFAHVSAMHFLALTMVGVAAAATVGISMFVKGRLEGDKTYAAKKTANK